MKNINIKKEITGSIEEVINKTTSALASQGFGVLTRIDFDKKIKEKLGKDMPATVVLGACNPTLAYEAFNVNPDVASVLPCNAVVREVGNGKISVEFVLPSAMMRSLGMPELEALAAGADKKMQMALESL